MIISLIAAIGTNNEIGNKNSLLWSLPNDLAHFRKMTSGHPIIMGLNTYNSIGRPLPNRTNIVLAPADTTIEGVHVVHSLDEAFTVAQETGTGECFVIGGGMVYRETISRANKLYITHVDGTFEADVFFPTIDEPWKKISEETHEKDETHNYRYTFTTYEKTA